MRIPELSRLDPNKKRKWDSTDNEQQFDEHMANPITAKLLTDLGWDKNSIMYEIDHQGFRNPPIDISNSIMTFGCSFTFGTGVKYEDNWPSQLGNKLNTSVYNASIPGASADNMYRIAEIFIPKYKPKAVFFLVPDMNRKEIIAEHIDDGFPKTFSVWDYDKPEFKEYTKFAIDEFQMCIKQRKNILACHAICLLLDIPFHFATVENCDTTIDNMDNNGRDLAHPGVDVHGRLADIMADLYRKGLTNVPKDSIIVQYYTQR